MDDGRKSTDVPGYRKRAITGTSSKQGSQNGASADYQQSISHVGPPTRAEVEARLKATSHSISSRLESLQSEMGLDGKLFADVASKPFVSVAMSLAIGYAVGRVLKSFTGGAEERESALADLLTDEVLQALDGEEPIHDAIQRVLSVADRPGNARADRVGFFRWVAGTALRSIIGQSVIEVARRFGPSEETAE